MNERQNRIMDILAAEGKMPVKDLAVILRVSAVTVRQDLTCLENKGILKRIHGAAMLKNADDLVVRLGINHLAKLIIARKAVEYVNDGETILIESGSVNALFATELVRSKNVTILTTNIFIARLFHESDKGNIILLGGIYQHQSESVVGMLTKTGIDTLNFSKAFIGIDGYDESAGFTSHDMFRAEISAYIIKKKIKTFILTDSSKFGKRELAEIGCPDEIACLITDEGIEDKYVRLLSDRGMDVVIAR